MLVLFSFAEVLVPFLDLVRLAGAEGSQEFQQACRVKELEAMIGLRATPFAGITDENDGEV